MVALRSKEDKRNGDDGDDEDVTSSALDLLQLLTTSTYQYFHMNLFNTGKMNATGISSCWPL